MDDGNLGLMRFAGLARPVGVAAFAPVSGDACGERTVRLHSPQLLCSRRGELKAFCTRSPWKRFTGPVRIPLHHPAREASLVFQFG